MKRYWVRCSISGASTIEVTANSEAEALKIGQKGVQKEIDKINGSVVIDDAEIVEVHE